MSTRSMSLVALLLVLALTVGCEAAGSAQTPVPPASPLPATPVPPTATLVPPTPMPTALPGALTVAAPPGNPPTLDGTLSPGEWDSARREKFSDGSELLLMHNGGYLYLGIRANIQGVSVWSVCIDRGDEIAVLHSSAALGTAVYKRAEGGWQRTRTFAWTLRDTSFSETAQQQRKQFLEKEGWLASLGSMGKPEETEFQLAIPQGSLRLVVAFLLPPNYDTAAWWPIGLDDDSRKVVLLQGNTPATLQFSPETWMTVTASAPGAGSPAGSGGGVIAFTSERDGNMEIYIMNADGSDPRRLTNNRAKDLASDWSPDGKKLACMSRRDGHFEVCIMNADGSDQQQLTSGTRDNMWPAWSPDGKKIAFQSQRDGNFEIYVMNADGTDLQRLTNTAADDMNPDWSPDGTQIAFDSARDGNLDIYMMNADGSNERRLTTNPVADMDPAWSPDGKRIAFMSGVPGQFVLYLMDANGGDVTKLPIGDGDGWCPTWSPDGKQIAFYSYRPGPYRDGKPNAVYVVSVDDSNLRQLTELATRSFHPVWRP